MALGSLSLSVVTVCPHWAFILIYWLETAYSLQHVCCKQTTTNTMTWLFIKLLDQTVCYIFPIFALWAPTRKVSKISSHSFLGYLESCSLLVCRNILDLGWVQGDFLRWTLWQCRTLIHPQNTGALQKLETVIIHSCCSRPNGSHLSQYDLRVTMSPRHM